MENCPRLGRRAARHWIAAAAATLSLGTVGDAEQFAVTNNTDAGAVGSLRWAIGQANASGGPATIVFASPHTITLNSDLPPLTNPSGITINGANAIIDGGSASNTTGYREFFVGVSPDIANANLQRRPPRRSASTH